MLVDVTSVIEHYNTIVRKVRETRRGNHFTPSKRHGFFVCGIQDSYLGQQQHVSTTKHNEM